MSKQINELDTIKIEIVNIEIETLEIINKTEVSSLARVMLFDPTSEEAEIFDHLDTYLDKTNFILESLRELEKIYCEEKDKNLISDLIDKTMKIINNINIFFSSVTQISEYLRLFEEVDNNKKELNEYIAKSKKDINKVEQRAKKHFDKVNRRLAKSDKHSMEIITIFTAIIAIIVSVVVTSSSWLNNANSKQAIIAFVVPSLVVIISIIILLCFISFMYPVGLFRQIAAGVTFLVLLLFIGHYGIVVVPELLEEPYVYHKIYEIQEYDIIQENDIKYYKFKVDNVLYMIEYDCHYEKDNIIYFCSIHNSLEIPNN